MNRRTIKNETPFDPEKMAREIVSEYTNELSRAPEEYVGLITTLVDSIFHNNEEMRNRILPGDDEAERYLQWLIRYRLEHMFVFDHRGIEGKSHDVS